MTDVAGGGGEVLNTQDRALVPREPWMLGQFSLEEG